MNRRLGLAALAMLLALTPAARAQDAATGAVAGRVTDASGAAVAGVKVKATRTATGAVRETTTDADGNHVLTSLVPGEYRIEFEAAGFNPRALDHALVQVGARLTVDAVLDVQGRAETIEVSEPGVSVPTGNGLVGGVVGQGVVENLPLNGRNFLELAFLLPGNAPAPNFDPTKTNVVAISSAGQLGRGGNITIDGQDNNDDVVGGPLANLPQDAVQEFQMATNRFSAEQGRSAASAMNVVTRSGSDTLARVAERLPARRRAAGAAGHLRPHPGSAAVRPPAVLRHARRADRARQGVVVRGGGVPQPGLGGADRHARRRRAHDPPEPGRGAAQRLPGHGADRRPRHGQGHARLPLPGAGRGRRRRQHARPLDRLGHAAAGERQPPPAGPRDLDARARRHGREHAARELQRLPQRDRPGDARPPAHLPEHPGRRELPRAAGNHPDALAVLRLAVLGQGRPHAARRSGVLAHLRALRPRSLPRRAASSWCRTSRSST